MWVTSATPATWTRACSPPATRPASCMCSMRRHLARCSVPSTSVSDRRPRSPLMSVTALLLAALSVSGYKAPHEARGVPPRAVDVASFTYVDKGLVAAGRLPAGTVDFLGD